MNDNHSSSAWSTYSRTVFIAFAVIALGLIAGAAGSHRGGAIHD